MTRLRVGVNLTFVRPGRVGGTEEYLTRLLGALADGDGHDDGLGVTLVVLPGFPAAHPDLAARFRCEVAPVPGGVRPLRVLAESTWMARRTGRLDLVHHAGGTVPVVAPRSRPPAVVTVHDLQYLDHPEFFHPAKRRWLARSVPRAVACAARVQAPSRATAAALTSRLGVAADRLDVVPHGIGDPPVDPAPDDTVPRPYVVYPAVTHPHKNHAVLLEALAGVDGLHLALPGGRGRADDEVTAAAARPGLRGRVHRLGRVPAPTLGALVRDATALVFPSRYEGFGAPVVEAMRLGRPILAADAGSLPEVVGGAGRLIDPDDVDAWREALAALADPGVVAELTARSWAARDRFRPGPAVEALVSSWRAAVGG